MFVFNASAIVNREMLTILPSIADIKVPIAVIGRIILSGIIIDPAGSGESLSEPLSILL
jgi:hypothetical protein